jgi:hypothetical protein
MALRGSRNTLITGKPACDFYFKAFRPIAGHSARPKETTETGAPDGGSAKVAVHGFYGRTDDNA